MDAHVNGAYSTVSTAPSPATSGTSLMVAGGTWPAVPFNATVHAAGATEAQVASGMEIVRVTANSSGTFTIARAAEGPNGARSIVVGDVIKAGVTAKTLTDIEAGVVNKGSSFPGSPSANDLFYHTTYEMLFYFDGTRWLTTTLSFTGFREFEAQSGTNTDSYISMPQVLDIWVVSFQASFITIGGSNDVSNHWTCQMGKLSTANALTLIGSPIDNGAVAVSTWLAASGAVGAAIGGSATWPALTYQIAPVGSPGQFYGNAGFSWRLIGV